MPPQPYPYVSSAAIQNGMIVISVVFDHSASGTYVEISGSATQTGGAFATFSDVQQVPPTPNDPDDPISTDRYVFVSTRPRPPNQFRDDEDISVVMRVAKVWLTVLGSGVQAATTAEAFATWNTVRRVSEVGRWDWPEGEPV